MADGKVTCTILFFASASEAAGERERLVSLDEGSTVADVFAKVSQDCQPLAALKSSCAFAIDEKIVQGDTEITDGCTVAVLPPVSGG
ncbi:MoaD/ThiS family protein [PVC group bacterium]|nr:MoaD/ThiS family protein [PVC group bacterium]MDP6541716.1 MoaD/ThiS family protein [Phycisphaerales bacterium]